MDVIKLREIKQAVDNYKRVRADYDAFTDDKSARGELVLYNHPLHKEMDEVAINISRHAIEWLSYLLTEISFMRLGIMGNTPPPGDEKAG